MKSDFVRNVLLILLALASVGPRQNASEHAIVPAKFDEVWVPEVPLAGEVLVGVQQEALSQHGGRFGQLWVRLPRTDRNKLCLSVTSSDGRYSAEAEYEIRYAGEATIQLAFPTRYERQLAKYGSGRIAFLAKLASSCSSGSPTEDDEYVVVGLSMPERTTSFFIVINSGGDHVRLFTPPAEYQECTSVQGETKKVAFDTICSASVPANSKLWDGYIVRKRFEVRKPDIHLQVALP